MSTEKLPKFPKHCCLDEKHYCERDAWKEEFVAQLEAEQIPRILDAMAEIYDDRSDYQKGFKAGYVECLLRVLDAFK